MTPTDKATTAEDTLDQLLRISLPTIEEVDGREYMALAMKLKMGIRTLEAEHRIMREAILGSAHGEFCDWTGDGVHECTCHRNILASLTLRP